MAPKRKSETVISFKADPALLTAMEGIPNRSQFIRRAIISALEGVCPLCQGTGILSPQQRRHWAQFARTHELARCEECEAFHLVCHQNGPLPLESLGHVPAAPGQEEEA
ncbi:MAG: CopG family transcriptional regulator [Deltaproteobacteria bacterium]|nr:CopG family transcriptional regulator [Deltaproteobacteria bacterium]